MVLFREGTLYIPNTSSKFTLNQIYQCLSICLHGTSSFVYQGFDLYFMPLGWIRSLFIFMVPDLSNDPWACVSGCFLWLCSWLCMKAMERCWKGQLSVLGCVPGPPSCSSPLSPGAQSVQGFAEKCTYVWHWSGSYLGFYLCLPQALKCCRGIWHQRLLCEAVLKLLLEWKIFKHIQAAVCLLSVSVHVDLSFNGRRMVMFK